MFNFNISYKSVFTVFRVSPQQNKEQAVQLGKVSHSEGELTETTQRLRETVARVREELRTSQAQAEKGRQEAERCARRSAFFFFCCSDGKEKEGEESLPAPLSILKAPGGPAGEVVGGQARAAGARGRAAAEVLAGQRETAEGSSGSEEGRSPFKGLLLASRFMSVVSPVFF